MYFSKQIIKECDMENGNKMCHKSEIFMSVYINEFYGKMKRYLPNT